MRNEACKKTTNFCHHIFVHNIFSLAKPDSYLSCESLALQDYNSLACDEELAMVPRLDILACEQH